MLHQIHKGRLLTLGSDRNAVDVREFPDVRAKAWFDAQERVCKLELELAWKLELELTAGATSVPITRQLIEAQGGDPEQWRDAALLEALTPQPRPPGRPGGRLWSTISLALSVFFEVKRLEQVAHPKKTVADNRGKSKVDISRLYRLGETILAAK